MIGLAPYRRRNSALDSPLAHARSLHTRSTRIHTQEHACTPRLCTACTPCTRTHTCTHARTHTLPARCVHTPSTRTHTHTHKSCPRAACTPCPGTLRRQTTGTTVPAAGAAPPPTMAAGVLIRRQRLRGRGGHEAAGRHVLRHGPTGRQCPRAAHGVVCTGPEELHRCPLRRQLERRLRWLLERGRRRLLERR